MFVACARDRAVDCSWLSLHGGKMRTSREMKGPAASWLASNPFVGLPFLALYLVDWMAN